MTSENGAPPSAAEAREALRAVAESQQALGPYIGSPRWLYPAQGFGIGLFIIGVALSKSHGWATAVLAASVIIFCVLPLLLSNRTRVNIDVYTHRGSRGLGLLYLGTLTVLIAAVLVLHALFGADWMVYAAALLAFVLTVILGPAMEERLGRRIGGAH